MWDYFVFCNVDIKNLSNFFKIKLIFQPQFGQPGSQSTFQGFGGFPQTQPQQNVLNLSNPQNGLNPTTQGLGAQWPQGQQNQQQQQPPQPWFSSGAPAFPGQPQVIVKCILPILHTELIVK